MGAETLSCHSSPEQQQPWPPEFICPISKSVMSDPVIVDSGQTYERRCIEAWFNIGQRTCPKQSMALQHLFLIPNIALRTSILNFSQLKGMPPPKPPPLDLALSLAKKFIPSDCKNSAQIDEICAISIGNLSHSATGKALRDVDRRASSAQKETLPLTLTTRPVSSSRQMQEEHIDQKEQSCFIDSCLIEKLVNNLQHMHAMEIEKAAQKLLQLTRQSAESRRDLYTPELLSVLLPHLRSRYTGIQVFSLAVMVNLSLEKENKIKIVRAGAVLFLIDVLKSGNSEAQGHAAGAIFSLALEDENKIAIGVLGAIPPLIHLFRTGSVSTRKDAAMALYHLSHSRVNRAKLVKVGAVPILLNIAQEEKGDLACRALLILCNIAATPEGRAAMLELNAINTLIKFISSNNLDEIQEHAAALLLFLSQSILRFKSLVMEAGALETIRGLS